MDKTAWFVVSVCVALLGLNFWYQSQQQPQTPPPASAVIQQTQNTAQHTATPSSDEQESATTTPENALGASTSPASTTTATAPIPPMRQPVVLATLASRDERGNEVARYTFQDMGGSVSKVDMVGKAINSTRPELRQDVSLNGSAGQGIGTLMFGLSNEQPPAFDQSIYRLIPEQTNEHQVALLGRVGDLIVRKIYVLKPVKQGDKDVEGNRYILTLKIDFQNAGTQTLAVNNWGVYAGGMSQISHEETSRYTHYVMLEDGDFRKESIGSFTPWFFGSDKDRVYRKDLENLAWGGVMNQYYSLLLKPTEASGNDALYAAPGKYTLPVTKEEVEGLEVGLGIPDFTLSPRTADMPGGQKSLSYEIFAGPKLNLMLSDMTDDFRMIDRIMDYGWLYLLSYPMNWLINVFHDWFGNWGWAIVAMTFVVRLLIWPLYRKSYMSMKRMSLLQPRMKELKEKYPDDQQKVSMEMMKLYREYGISPVGGCLPMFLQIPIFFAFFYVLQTAAEFRGAPFIGWVTDLSQMDTVCTIPVMGWELPLNILPIVMAISMIIQMHMTPQAGDPMQQKIMKFMPLMFFLFCYTYPSALALYWTTTNIISILQTWIIRRMPMPELKKAPARPRSGKKGFFERMMEAQQAALAEQQRQANMRNVTKR